MVGSDSPRLLAAAHRAARTASRSSIDAGTTVRGSPLRTLNSLSGRNRERDSSMPSSSARAAPTASSGSVPRAARGPAASTRKLDPMQKKLRSNMRHDVFVTSGAGSSVTSGEASGAGTLAAPEGSFPVASCQPRNPAKAANAAVEEEATQAASFRRRARRCSCADDRGVAVDEGMRPGKHALVRAG